MQEEQLSPSMEALASLWRVLSTPMEQLGMLEQLKLALFPELTALPDLEVLQKLTSLELLQCLKLQGLQLGTSLKRLQVEGCDNLGLIHCGMDAISRDHTYQLQEVRVRGCPALHSFPGLQPAACLTLPDVLRCPQPQQLQPPSCLRLRVQDCQALTSIVGLSAPQGGNNLLGTSEQQQPQQVPLLPALSRVEISSCPALQQLQCLRRLPGLRHCVYDAGVGKFGGKWHSGDSPSTFHPWAVGGSLVSGDSGANDFSAVGDQGGDMEIG
jgi:hypothetical protein